MKKAISLVLAAVLALCMAGGAAADSIHLRYAELDVGENLLTVDAHYFADRVNELSGGRIIIDIYDSAQLGPEKEAVQGTQMGAIDICRATVTLLADFDMPMLNILGLPYIFVSREHCWKVLDSDIGDMLRAYPQAQKTGMVGLWFAEEGTRSLITVDGPVTRIDQIAGRKIRANNASLMIDTINAMGASAVPMAYTEVPVSLMSGTIEGLENSPYMLTKDEDNIMENARNNISMRVDKKNGIITIKTTAQDALICKALADSACSHLQTFITEYRTKKAIIDREYYKGLMEEAKAEYEKSRRQYASYADSYNDIILASFKTKLTDLENDMQLKYNNYTAMTTQFQAAQARVQERTPAFTMIKGATVPYRPTGPKRMLFVAGMLIFATILISLYATFKKEA